MSTWYSIRIMLNDDFHQKIIQNLLIRGLDIGYRYFNREEKKYISSEEALEIVSRGINKNTEETKHVISNSCFLMHLETNSYLSFYKQNGFLSLSLSPCGGQWYKREDVIDYIPHIQALIAVCQDHEILHLYASDDSHDEDFYYFNQEPQIEFEPTHRAKDHRKQYITITTIEECNDLDYVTTLLNCGITAGWIFCTPVTLQSVSIETAVQALLENAMKNSFRELALATHLTASLWGKIDDRYYGIKIGSRPNTCHTISIIAIDHPDNPQAQYNFHHIIRDALDLCTEFGILEIVTFDSRYNEYRIWNDTTEKMEPFPCR